MTITQKTSAVQAGELQACPVCGSGQAYPLEQQQVGSDSWRLLMHCPNCFAWRETSADTDTISALGRDLCREHEALKKQLAWLEHKHMQEAAESFISALQSDHIQPIDF